MPWKFNWIFNLTALKIHWIFKEFSTWLTWKFLEYSRNFQGWCLKIQLEFSRMCLENSLNFQGIFKAVFGWTTTKSEFFSCSSREKNGKSEFSHYFLKLRLVGVVKKSPILMFRVVDKLAKLGAAVKELPKGMVNLLDSATAVVGFSAKLLGRITYAANNHQVTVIGEDGLSVTQTIRDATPAPKDRNRKRDASPPPVTKKPKCPVAKAVKAWSKNDKPAPHIKSSVQSSTALHNARVKAYSGACLKRRVDEIGAASSSSGNEVPAASRIEALKRRVGERAGSISSSTPL